MDRGKLYLIPNTIAEHTQDAVITAQIRSALPDISHFLAEDIRTARRYLSSLKIYASIEALNFEVLNKDTSPLELKKLLAPLKQGLNMGVISESGCPGIADPGALAVKFAHEIGVRVVPMVGPSSILLGLMASGLNGQCFAFQGYLPIDVAEAGRAIRNFEKESRQKNQTQIFIETPYRSNGLFKLLVESLSNETLLCIAVDLTGASEDIMTTSVKKWRTMTKQLSKDPTVFLFLAN